MSDDMELKRALDALPREIEPPAGAWPAVRARLAADHGSRQRPAELRGFVWPEQFEPRTLRIAAAVAVVGLAVTYAAAGTRAASRWIYASWVQDQDLSLTNEIRVTRMNRPFTPGSTIATPANGGAQIEAGTFGRINVWQTSEVALIAARPLSQRLALRRGYITARIDAPARQFAIETPSGTVICGHCTLRLNADGAGTDLAVSWGAAWFAQGADTVLVPEGFRVATRHGGLNSDTALVRQWRATPRGRAVLAPRLSDKVRLLWLRASNWL